MPEIMSSKDAQNNFGLLLDTAQRTPVVVQRHGRDCVAVLSMRDYEIWQQMKNARLQQTMKDLGKKAEERGLTADMLEKLLAD